MKGKLNTLHSSGIMLILFLSSLLLTGCRTRTVIQPVTQIQEKYITARDTIMIRDSVFQSLRQSNDTVYLDKEVLRYRYTTRHDTVCIHDSIPYPVYIENTVYKSKPFLQTLKDNILIAALTILSLLIAMIWFRK